MCRQKAFRPHREYPKDQATIAFLIVSRSLSGRVNIEQPRLRHTSGNVKTGSISLSKLPTLIIISVGNPLRLLKALRTNHWFLLLYAPCRQLIGHTSY